MPTYCCIPGCTSKRGKSPGVSYHEIPSNLEIRQKWIKAISRKNWSPTDHTDVCSMHFLSTDFVSGLKIRRLLPNSVPSIFPSYPSYMQQPIKNPRSTSSIEKRSQNSSPAVNNKRKKKSDGSTPAADAGIEVPNSGNPTLSQPTPLVNGGIEVPNPETPTPLASVDIKVPNPESPTPIIFGRLTSDFSSQVDILRKYKNTELKTFKRKYRRLLVRMQKLQKKYDTFRTETTVYKREAKKRNAYQVVVKCAEEGNKSARMLVDQVENFTRQCPVWSEATIRNCLQWQHCSPKGYAFVGTNKLFKVPSRRTLKRFIGSKSAPPVEVVPQDLIQYVVPQDPTQDLVPQDLIQYVVPQDMVPRDPTQDMVSQDPTQDMVPQDPTQDMVPQDPSQDMVPQDPTQDMVPQDPIQHVVPQQLTQLVVPQNTTHFVISEADEILLYSVLDCSDIAQELYIE